MRYLENGHESKTLRAMQAMLAGDVAQVTKMDAANLGGIEASLCLEARRKSILPSTNLLVIPDSHSCGRAQVSKTSSI